jgi:MoaA/NifB/PqqE/SkfB family radical SAM enzyme
MWFKRNVRTATNKGRAEPGVELMFEDLLAERIARWRDGEKVGPFEVQLNPTNRCNLTCRFCWLRDFDDQELDHTELTTREYERLITECDEMGVHTIHITGGGEPLMRHDILSLMRKIKRCGMFGKLVTNGTLLSQTHLRELVRIGWDEIVFSLDAPDREVNDYLRGQSFDRVVTAIRSLQVMKIDMGKERPMVHIHMVLCNRNFHLLPRMFEFVYELNCRNLLIEPITLLARRTGAGKDLLLDPTCHRDLIRYVKEAIDISHRHNFQTNLAELEFGLIASTSDRKKIIQQEGWGEKDAWLSIPCYQPFYFVIVRPWGVVGPCCMFDNVGMSVKEHSLPEIWFGTTFGQMRDRMLRRRLPDFCSKCNPSQVQTNRKIRAELKKLK